MYARRRTALDVGLEMVGAMMDLDEDGDENYFLAVTCGRNFKPGWECFDRTQHNEPENREGRCP